MNLLAEITVHTGSDEGLISLLIHILIIGAVCAIIWWLGKMACGAMNLPPRVLQVWNGLFIVVGAIVVINFLLGLGGHPFIRW